MAAVDRASDPQAWLEAAYSDDPIVTHLDAEGTPVSSCSMPLMVFGMLQRLGPARGQRVLEIGTGTGWNAALLTARLGPSSVFTIEVDAEVAGEAAANLAAADLNPTLAVGDGMAGLAREAPFDRLIATCAVNRVPYEWVEQTQPGGVIVTPWSSGVGLGGLVRLVVDHQGAASGPFVDTASFMWLRAQTPDHPDEPDDFEDRAEISRVSVDLDALRSNIARFVVGLMVPQREVIRIQFRSLDMARVGRLVGIGQRR